MQQARKDTRESVDLLVLGAGICGLTLAQELVNAGKKSWLIIDKGRSVGGRMATRRIEGQKFDHGAQFFTARSLLFKQLVDTWLGEGIVKEWTKGFNHHFHSHAHGQPIDDGHPRYTGVGGMNQIAKHLVSKLPDDKVLLSEKIIEISIFQDMLLLKSEGGREIQAKNLVITFPIPQTLDLLKSIDHAASFEVVREELAKITYDPCIAFMGFFDADEFPLDALPIQSHDAVISFIADNYSKGLTSERGLLTVHLAAEASRGMFTAHDQVIVGFICHQLKQLFGLKKLSTPKTYDIQRWRYATPQTTLPGPYLEWPGAGALSPRILFAGEGFGGPKIEGAFLSAQAAARRLLGQL